MERKDTGLLLDKQNITPLQRFYFDEMTRLLGINVLFRRLKNNQSKQYDLHGELDAIYEPAVVVGCIYENHADQKTMRKLGWNAERVESTPVIHVPYDLEGLQAGTLFIIPSGLDNASGRVFKVLEMSNIPIYPASIACRLGPVLESDFERSQTRDFTRTDFNVLNDEEGSDEIHAEINPLSR